SSGCTCRCGCRISASSRACSARSTASPAWSGHGARRSGLRAGRKVTAAFSGIFYAAPVTGPRHNPRHPRAPGADAGGGRREPDMGTLGGLDFTPRVPRTRRLRVGARGGWWPWLLGFALLATLLLVVFRKPLADQIWPQTRAQALRAQAAQALAQGRLTAPDGSGARELYEAALAMDPDRDEARVGLARVAEAALARARDETAQDRFADAHASLRLARALSVPRAEADRVAARLREREASH